MRVSVLSHLQLLNLMTVLSSSYGNIMDHAMNAPGRGNNVVDGLNATDKLYLKGKRDLLIN